MAGARDEASLLDCLVNREQVAACMAQPGQRFRLGDDAREAAAVEIQAGTRMALSRKRVTSLRYRRAAAEVITRKGKARAVRSDAKRRLQARAEEQQAAWKKSTAKFHREWPRIKQGGRVIIHLPSLSVSEAQRRTIPNLEVRQNTQMPRLCDVREPGVDVMYAANPPPALHPRPSLDPSIFRNQHRRRITSAAYHPTHRPGMWRPSP
jgi:hypothetical protein